MIDQQEQFIWKKEEISQIKKPGYNSNNNNNNVSFIIH